MGKKIQVMALYEAKDDVSGLLSRLKDADEEIEIDVLSSVTDLIEKLQEDEYDCVLSDSCVQGLDAIELGKKVKELYNMPFFIYTIKESEELVFQALQEGIPYFNACDNKNAHKKLLKRIKFVAEKARRRKNGDTLNYFDRPTVFVQGSDIYLIEDDGSETLWGSEGEYAEPPHGVVSSDECHRCPEVQGVHGLFSVHGVRVGDERRVALIYCALLYKGPNVPHYLFMILLRCLSNLSTRHSCLVIYCD